MLIKTEDGDFVAKIHTEKDILSCYPCSRETVSYTHLRAHET
jgi:hypothetical protein